MVAVIAYQSLNSNASTTHDLAASTSQYFTRKAQRTLAPMYTGHSGALKYPTSPKNEPHEAIQGPPDLVPVADESAMDLSRKRKRSARDDGEDPGFVEAKSRTLSMVEGKARQIYQQAYREMSVQCDLIAFGELDSTHAEWGSMTSEAGGRVHTSEQPKACNCFSLHSSGSAAETAVFVDEGEGWCAARCKGVLVVFVHVPNSIARSKTDATRFYNTIKTRLLTATGGGVVDVVMGDTNQASEHFSPEVISRGMDLTFADADTKRAHTAPVDTWSHKGDVGHRGTNSVNNKKFDVVVYNTGTVKHIDINYFTQLSFTSNQAAAYTDHMGVMIKVSK